MFSKCFTAKTSKSLQLQLVDGNAVVSGFRVLQSEANFTQTFDVALDLHAVTDLISRDLDAVAGDPG